MKIETDQMPQRTTGSRMARLTTALRPVSSMEFTVMDTPLASTTSRRWMLVDDNTDLLMLLAAVVENLTGAAIECYNTPQAALAAYSAAPETYELVITDFEMPGMNGVELCRQMRAVTPAQRIFLATGSGYFSEVAARAFGFCALLNKPYPVTALQTALASVGLSPEATCAA